MKILFKPLLTTALFLSILNLSVSLRAQNLQNGRVEFNQFQQKYFENNRSKSEKLNPFENPNQFKDNEEVDDFIKKTSSIRFRYVYDKTLNEVSVFDQLNGDELVSIFKLTTKENLQTYRPSQFKKRLEQMSSELYSAGKSGVKHTVLNLPIEVSIFYMAMGSVSAFYLFSNAGQNPAALNLFVNQQLSAVGLTSLFMFLASQNATSNIAQLIIKNPKWYTMLPYLSMTVGTMVQNYSTSIMTDPNIKACIGEMFGTHASVDGASDEPCDKAFEYFTLQKPWEFAPGLMSMLTTTALASAAQYSIAKTALTVESRVTSKLIKNETIKNITKVSLLRFAGFLNPGMIPFMAAEGIWLYLSKASNLQFFAALDHQISNSVTFAVKNLQESYSIPFVNSIKKTSDLLTLGLVNEKNNNWSIERNVQNCDKYKNADCSGFYENLISFKDQMRMWRMANLSEVIETHHSWETYLGDLVARYSVTKEFYRKFITEAKKYKLNPKNEENFLERYYPFWGVRTSLTKYYDETHITDPQLPESEQLKLVISVKENILNYLKNPRNREKLFPIHHGSNYSSIYEFFLEKFENNNGATFEDRIRLGQGIGAFRDWINEKIKQGKGYYGYNDLYELYKPIGSPNPQLNPGTGYIMAIERSPEINSLYQNIDLSRDNKLLSFSKYNSYSEVILRNMICGPNLQKNEPLIDETWGFSAHFTSPRITDFIDVVKDGNKYCDSTNLLLNQVDTKNINIKNNSKPGYLYSSPFDYLKRNLSRELYKESVDSWWKRNTEYEISKSFEKFQEMYNANIVKLLSKLMNPENSKWNRSNTVANGILLNTTQELRFYLIVLGEIIKDHFQKENKTFELNSLVDKLESSKQSLIKLESDEFQVSIPEVIKYQARGSFLDLNSIFIQLNNHSLKTTSTSSNIRFLFQSNLEKQFAHLIGLLGLIHSSEKDGKYNISGNVTNDDFDKVIEEIENQIKTIAKMLDVQSKDDTIENNGYLQNSAEIERKEVKNIKTFVNLNGSTKQIAVKALEYIQELAYEIKAYGMIINAVNMKSILNLKNQSEMDNKYKIKVNEILSNINMKK